MEQKEEMEQRLILPLFILPPFQFYKTSYNKSAPSRKFPALWRKGSISSWTFLDETKKNDERERERDLHFIMKSFSLYICAHCAPVLIKREACHWKFDAAWSNRETELALVFGRASTSNWITTTQKDGTFSLSPTFFTLLFYYSSWWMPWRMGITFLYFPEREHVYGRRRRRRLLLLICCFWNLLSQVKPDRNV